MNVSCYLDTYNCILARMIHQMCGVRLTDSISHNFIEQMIPHHRAAIEMSENVLRYTMNMPLREIAVNIIKEQTKSIEDMRRIDSACGMMTNSMSDLCEYQKNMEQIMQTMFWRMKHAEATGRIDCDFMWEMIPHHMGAVEMSSNTLQFDICPELTAILQAIITSQKKGIEQMRYLLSSIDCTKS